MGGQHKVAREDHAGVIFGLRRDSAKSNVGGGVLVVLIIALNDTLQTWSGRDYRRRS